MCVHVCMNSQTHPKVYMSCVSYMFMHNNYNIEFDTDLYHKCIYVQMYVLRYVHKYMCICIHSYINKRTDIRTYVAMYLHTYIHNKNLIRLFILILIRYAVILKCWKTDVDERLSFKDIVEELCSLSNYL